MTVETNDERHPWSEALIKRVRVVMLTMKDGTNCCEVFLEPTTLGVLPHEITGEFLRRRLNQDRLRRPPPVSFAENPALSLEATKIFMTYRSSADDQSAFEQTKRFIALAVSLSTVPQTPIA